jgi:hypothetical protein
LNLRKNLLTPSHWHAFCVCAHVTTNTHTTGEQWEFRCGKGAGHSYWRWRRRDAGGVVIHDFGEMFPTLKAAIADAVRHGFAYRLVPR